MKIIIALISIAFSFPVFGSDTIIIPIIRSVMHTDTISDAKVFSQYIPIDRHYNTSHVNEKIRLEVGDTLGEFFIDSILLRMQSRGEAITDGSLFLIDSAQIEILTQGAANIPADSFEKAGRRSLILMMSKPIIIDDYCIVQADIFSVLFRYTVSHLFLYQRYNGVWREQCVLGSFAS